VSAHQKRLASVVTMTATCSEQEAVHELLEERVPSKLSLSCVLAIALPIKSSQTGHHWALSTRELCIYKGLHVQEVV
jgi:glucokinase